MSSRERSRSPNRNGAVHFSARPRPTSESSREYVSSASSYAASQTSSSFTLSSTTDGSSASSGLFENQRNPNSSSSTSNLFTAQLKKLYQQITRLEDEIKQYISEETWEKRIQTHKKFVANVQKLLEVTLAPSGPASLRNITTKYNLQSRLWTHGFSILLEALRRAAFLPSPSHIALEHLNDFISYAYVFYAGLLEEPQMSAFRTGWLEALGDLARYKSMVESFLERSEKVESSVSGQQYTLLSTENLSESLRMETLSQHHLSISHEAMHLLSAQSNQRGSIKAHTLSIGPHAAALLALEPDSVHWRGVAREWYGMGLNEQPGTGKLHHHIGLLCRDAVSGTLDTKELMMGVYHFYKSMVALHPCLLSRESILPLFASAMERQSTFVSPTPASLFVILHYMLFTETDLETFDRTLARFMESIGTCQEPISGREWATMATINLAAVLEPGKSIGILRMAMGGLGTNHEGDSMDTEEAGSKKPAPTFIHALELTFTLLSHVLRNPYLAASQSLNPYLSILMTFLVTIIRRLKRRNRVTYNVIESFVPWHELANFLQHNVPRDIWESQRLVPNPPKPFVVVDEHWPMLTTSTAPLPEDWCLRGMEWVGRQVYGRGFWKDHSGDDEKFGCAEIKYLYGMEEERSLVEGQNGYHFYGITSTDPRYMPPATTKLETTLAEIDNRFIRILRCGVILSTLVPGFSWIEGTTEFSVHPSLAGMDNYAMQVDD